MGEDEDFLRLLSEVDMATVSESVCKPGTVWKMTGDVYRNFPRKDLQDIVRPWYAFVCASLMPTAHLSDVTRERAILLHALVSGKSIDVGRVIFDHFMQSIRATHGGICFPCLISAICADQGVQWDKNEEIGGVMKPLDGARLAEFLGYNPPPKKRSRSTAGQGFTAGVGSSSSRPPAAVVQTTDRRLDRMEHMLDYHGAQLAFQQQLLLQQRTFQAASTQFLYDTQRMIFQQSGGDMSAFPAMPVFPDLPDEPVFMETEDDDTEDTEDDEDEE